MTMRSFPKRQSTPTETETVNRRTLALSRLSIKRILTTINDEDLKVPLAVRTEVPAITRATDLIVNRLRLGGRLIYVGAGTSGRLAILDAAELFPTFGAGPELVRAIIAGGKRALTRPVEGAEDKRKDGAKALRGIGANHRDAVLGISASGRTPFVLGALAQARRYRAATLALTANPKTPIWRFANITICPRTGPEVVMGSTRMKAGTATKLVLNMISTTAMLRLGRAYGNLMVNVRPVSSKLSDRAKRIVAMTTGLSETQATRILRDTSMNVPLAILIARTGLERGRGASLLRRTRGSLQAALLLAEESKHHK